MMQSNSNFWH